MGPSRKAEKQVVTLTWKILGAHQILLVMESVGLEHWLQPWKRLGDATGTKGTEPMHLQMDQW